MAITFSIPAMIAHQARAPARHAAGVACPEFGVTLETVDDDGAPVPFGAVGILRCRDPQAAAPLDEAAAAEPGADAGAPGGRAEFRDTDDLGRFDEEGFLYSAGCSSGPIVRASVNICAEELEPVIRTHAGVCDAAVPGRAAADVGEEPVALVAPRQPCGLSAPDLLAYCRPKVSGNKSPAEIFFVGELQRALAGKAKRAALPALLRAVSETKAAAAADRSAAP